MTPHRHQPPAFSPATRMTYLHDVTQVDSSGMDDAMPPDWLTASEVASMLRVSKMTVYRLVHSGELAAVRVGKSFRISRTSVSSLLDEQHRWLENGLSLAEDVPS